MAAKNIMIVGVGGQGTLLTSRVLGGLATRAGYDVKRCDIRSLWRESCRTNRRGRAGGRSYCI